MKKIILIPSRLKSTRLPLKALLRIEGLPLVIHTYKRACLSKLADEVYICTDSIEILNICKKYNAKAILTKKKHKNGTERIFEAAQKLKLNNNDIVIDVQGDEPLIHPLDIDKIIKFFIKNKFEVVVPHIKFYSKNKTNIVKLLINKNKRIMWMTRSDCPNHNSNRHIFNKHLSVIVFTYKSLHKYSKLKISKYEKIESIELLRALENEMNLGSNEIKSDSFSIDLLDDYLKAKNYFKKDKIKYLYLK